MDKKKTMKNLLLILFLFVGFSASAQFINNNARIFNVLNFGARPYGKRILDGAMTAGGHTFTSATAGFTALNIGDLIRIPQAAGDIITTITGFTNSTTVTVGGSAPGSNISADTVIYGPDCTAAIQAAILSCGLAGGGTIYFPTGPLLSNGDNGMYLVGGACQTGVLSPNTNPNAQIYFPVAGFSDNGANHRTHFTIKGETKPEFTPVLIGGDSLVPHHGTIIYSMIDGVVSNSLPPSVFGTIATSGGFGAINYNYFTFEDLTILTAPNVGNGGTTMTGINGYYTSSTSTKNVLIAADHSLANQPAPTNKAAGVIYNIVGSEVMSRAEDTWVSNYYYGPVVTEGTIVDNLVGLGDVMGLVVAKNFVPINITYAQQHYCVNNIYSPNTAILGGMITPGNSYINISTDMMEMYLAGSPWWKNVLCVSDSGNHIIGNMNLDLNTSFTGITSSAYSVFGAANFQSIPIDIPQWINQAAFATSIRSALPVFVGTNTSFPTTTGGVPGVNDPYVIIGTTTGAISGTDRVADLFLTNNQSAASGSVGRIVAINQNATGDKRIAQMAFQNGATSADGVLSIAVSNAGVLGQVLQIDKTGLTIPSSLALAINGSTNAAYHPLIIGNASSGASNSVDIQFWNDANGSPSSSHGAFLRLLGNAQGAPFSNALGIVNLDGAEYHYQGAGRWAFATYAAGVQFGQGASTPTQGYVEALSTTVPQFSAMYDATHYTTFQTNSAGNNTITPSGGTLTLAGNVTLPLAKVLTITEGSSGRIGQVALVAGTKAITITGLTTSSRAFITLVTPNTVTSTVNYQAVCTSNTLTIQANVAAGTINTADISTLNYFVIN